MKIIFRKTVLLITFILSLTIFVYSAYSTTRTVEMYVIDAETCMNCGNCYSHYPDTFDVFNQQATWVRLGGSFSGLLFLYYPTQEEESDISEAIEECLTGSIFPG